MHKSTLMILTATIATLGATALHAAPGEHADRFPIDIAEAEARQAERFNRIDTNQDGHVSLAEFEQAKMPRMRHGGPGHGKHEPKAGAGEGHGPGHRAMDPDRRDAWRARHEAMRAAVDAELFKLLDTNGDGVLSAAEHQAKSKDAQRLAHRRALFTQLDRNTDGALTAEEMPSRTRHLRAMDSNADGQVTLDEARAFRADRAGRAAG